MNPRIYDDLAGGTIGGLLAARAQAAPDKTALVYDGGLEYTYRELFVAAESAAYGLRHLTRGEEATLGVLMNNIPEHLIAWFGAALAKLIYASINTSYTMAFLDSSIRDRGVSILITEEEFLGAIEELESIPETLSSIVVVGDTDLTEVRGIPVIRWSTLSTLRKDGETLPTVSASDIAAIKPTSGTTGRSKGVVTPHLHSTVAAREASVAMEVTSSDRLYTCLPLFHGAALINICLNSIYAGATIILGRRFSASRFWNDIRRFDVTTFNALGSMLPVLLKGPRTEDDKNHRVDRIFAAPATPDVLYPFEERFGIHIIEGYGSSETKNILYNPRRGRRVGSLGLPTASSIVEVLDDLDRPAAPGVVGEIVYRPRFGHIMMVEYYNDPRSTLSAMSGLWWHTGDLGYKDEAGYFYFVDRKKEVIRRKGENISSFEVERVLRSHASVADAVVIGVDSELGEQEVCAVIEAGSETKLTFDELSTHCQTLLPPFMVPRYFVQLDELPKTPTGKVTKPEVKTIVSRSTLWEHSSDLRSSNVRS